MEFTDYLRLVRDRWTWLVGGLLLGAVAAGLMATTSSPVYSSSARIYFSVTPDASLDPATGGTTAAQRVASFADVATGEELAERVVAEEDLDLTPAELSSKITAAVAIGTVILNVNVSDTDPRRAQQINVAVVDDLRTLVAQLERRSGDEAPLLTTSVVDAPSLPAASSGLPASRTILLGAALGFFLGFGIAVVRQLSDSTIRSTDSASAHVPAPLLATIPQGSRRERGHTILDAPSSAAAEAFRVLKANSAAVLPHDAPVTVLVTSASAGEGKTVVSVNTALAFAEGAQRVLLVDAQFRQPRVADLLGLETDRGLTSVLEGHVDLDQAMQRVGRLDVLASGPLPANPAELLQSQAMHAFLASVRKKYDVTVLDSPALLPLADAGALASQTDRVVLVLAEGSTTTQSVAHAVQRLGVVGADTMGFVHNRARTARHRRLRHTSPDRAASAGRPLSVS